MSYQTGTASSTIDLLQKIGTWLASIGWTIDSSIARGTGWRLHAHKAALYINFSAAFNENGATAGFLNTVANVNCYFLALYAGTGYSAGSDWRSQAGGPTANGYPTTIVGCGCPLPSGSIVAYHFFGDATGDNIGIVIEKTAGVFTHLFWGSSLNKIGSWTGGPYFGAALDVNVLSYPVSSAQPGCLHSAYPPGCSRNYPESYVRADVDTFTGKWIGIGDTTGVAQGYTGKIGGSSHSCQNTANNGLDIAYVISRATSNLTAQSLLFPIVLTAVRDSPGFSLLGSIPNIFASNACRKGFTAGSDYLWGGDTYKIFPGPYDVAVNQDYGFAIKKV